jgi:hypothetical protein
MTIVSSPQNLWTAFQGLGKRVKPALARIVSSPSILPICCGGQPADADVFFFETADADVSNEMFRLRGCLVGKIFDETLL